MTCGMPGQSTLQSCCFALVACWPGPIWPWAGHQLSPRSMSDASLRQLTGCARVSDVGSGPTHRCRNRFVPCPGRAGSSGGRGHGLTDVLALKHHRFHNLHAARLRPIYWNEPRGAADQSLVTRRYQLLVQRSCLGVSDEVSGDREPARPGAACTTIHTRARPPGASRNPCNGTSCSSLHSPGPVHITGGSVS